ncbi:unnamed protein product [Urochloa humidicola]
MPLSIITVRNYVLRFGITIWGSKMMGQVNRERLAEFLGELQRKEDTNDRYVAALKGETLTRKRYERIQHVPPPAQVQASQEAAAKAASAEEKSKGK